MAPEYTTLVPTSASGVDSQRPIDSSQGALNSSRLPEHGGVVALTTGAAAVGSEVTDQLGVAEPVRPVSHTHGTQYIAKQLKIIYYRMHTTLLGRTQLTQVCQGRVKVRSTSVVLP